MGAIHSNRNFSIHLFTITLFTYICFVSVKAGSHNVIQNDYKFTNPRSQGKVAFKSWKLLNYRFKGDINETHKEYQQKLHIFLNQCEADKIAKLCNAADSNEKLFWKLFQSRRSSSQMSAFPVRGKL